MLQHQIITRALLKAKGRHVPEFFGLDEASFRELPVLGRHCEDELRVKAISVSPVRPRLSQRGAPGTPRQTRLLSDTGNPVQRREPSAAANFTRVTA